MARNNRNVRKRLGLGPIIPSVNKLKYANFNSASQRKLWFNQDGTDGTGAATPDPNELVPTSTGMLQPGAAIVPPSVYDAVMANSPLPSGLTVGTYTGSANKKSPPDYQIQFPNMNVPDGPPYMEYMSEQTIVTNFVVVSEADWITKTDAYLAATAYPVPDIDPGTPTNDPGVIVEDVVVEDGCKDHQFDIVGQCVDKVAVLIGLALVGYFFFSESDKGKQLGARMRGGRGPRMGS